MGKTKSPAPVIVRSHIGDSRGLIGQSVKMLFQFSQVNFWSTGTEYPMTCRLLSLKSITRLPRASFTNASAIFHSSGTVQSNACVPEGTSVNRKVAKLGLEELQRLSDAVSSDAATDWKEGPDPMVHLLSDLMIWSSSYGSRLRFFQSSSIRYKSPRARSVVMTSLTAS